MKVSTGLADTTGFNRFAYTPGVNVPNTNLILRFGSPDDEPLSPLPRTEFVQDLNVKYIDHVATQAPCDFWGVRFIKVYTNMNIHVTIMPQITSDAVQ